MSVSYCTLDELKAHVVIDSATNDSILTTLIGRASRRIDNICQRRFYGVYETHYYNPYEDVYDNALYLDDDLSGVEYIYNAGNNSDGTITADQYKLYPRNETPYYKIRLLSSTGVSWQSGNDPEDAIEISGTWGYVSGTVPPDEIKLACMDLTYWLYKRRGQAFAQRGMPEVGMVEIAHKVPEDVAAVLASYTRFNIR